MNTDRNKYLTEAMGLKPTYLMQDYKTSLDQNGKPMPDFSTPDGFFKLKEYITTTDHRHEFWGFYIDVLYNRGDTVSNTMDAINPDSLANNYYEFLKGCESATEVSSE